jgi:hypothetical protein
VQTFLIVEPFDPIYNPLLFNEISAQGSEPALARMHEDAYSEAVVKMPLDNKHRGLMKIRPGFFGHQISCSHSRSALLHKSSVKTQLLL